MKPNISVPRIEICSLIIILTACSLRFLVHSSPIPSASSSSSVQCDFTNANFSNRTYNLTLVTIDYHLEYLKFYKIFLTCDLFFVVASSSKANGTMWHEHATSTKKRRGVMGLQHSRSIWKLKS